jgi:hypothetical protein
MADELPIGESIDILVSRGFAARTTIDGEPGLELTPLGRLHAFADKVRSMGLSPPSGINAGSWRAKRMRELQRDAGNLLDTLFKDNAHG